MLSLARCREILGTGNSVTDQQLAEVVRSMYKFAGVILDKVSEKRLNTLTDTVAWSESDRADFEERAAILEFDGGFSRDDAEHRARDCIRRRQTGHRGLY